MIVDFVHDIVCPWCRIGKANLDNAISEWKGDGAPVEILLRPFQLNPQTPPEGFPFRAYMQQLTGADDPTPIWERVNQAGALAGLTFNWERIEKMPNTLLAHTLIYAVPEADRNRVLDALHKAYFEDGRDIGDRDTLLAIGSELGLDARALSAALGLPDFRNMISAQIEEIAGSGITGVPFFIFNDAVGLNGAHPPEVILKAMQQAQEMAVTAGAGE